MRDFRKSITIEEFLAIEDENIKKFVWLEGLVSQRSDLKRVNNEEKIGYYHITSKICKNVSNSFYRKTQLHEWIVYNRKTKKIKLSSKVDYIKSNFLKDYIKKDALFLIDKFLVKVSPTFCKKLIEGKLSTIGDLISYNRSYVVRKKDVSLRTLYNFMINGKQDMLRDIEDPENLENLEQLNSNLRVAGAFTYKLGEIDKLKEKYNEWYTKQSEKYDTLLGHRDDNAGDTDGEVSA